MTLHTERAAAAAAELHDKYSRQWWDQLSPGLQARLEPEYEAACLERKRIEAIIAKHFPDDAASISAAVFKANDGDYTGPTVSVAWAERFLAALGRSVAPHKQHDALRLAAGRALEALGWQTGTPPVKEGQLERYWIAKRSNKGVIYYHSGFYSNRYIAPLDDSCDEAPSCASPVSDGDGDFYWTGWFKDFSDETFIPIEGEVVAWVRPILDDQAITALSAALAGDKGKDGS